MLGTMEDDLDERVAALVAAHAADWFPQLSEPGVRVEIIATAVNRASRTWLLRTARDGPVVFVKVPGRPAAVPGTTRPRLLPLPDFSSKASDEYDALVRAEQTAGPHSAPVRPLARFEDPPAVVMEAVMAPTLRAMLRGVVVPGRQRRLTDAVRATGAWLRQYHSIPPTAGATERLHHRDHIAMAARDLAAYADHPAAARLAGAVSRFAGDAEVVAVHGDFSPGNVFVRPDRRVAVVDMAAPALAPRWLDLAQMLTGLETSAPVAAARPIGAGRRLRRALLDGYRVAPEECVELAVFEGLTLLDKWAATAARARAGSSRDRTVLRVLASLARERTQRLLSGARP